MANDNLQKDNYLRNFVYIPKVYNHYSSNRVLTCEWINGLAFSDFKSLNKAKAHRKLLNLNIIKILIPKPTK